MLPRPWIRRGKIWTDEKGMTLYERVQDEKTSPVATTHAPRSGRLTCRGRRQAYAEWTVIDRTGGSKQWAYNGHPTYTFDEDKKHGDAKGDGAKDEFGEWHALKEEK
jgi:predicted lipoprotein with Yx(FWY)xxD motif